MATRKKRKGDGAANAAAKKYWATLSPEEQLEAIRRGYTPFAHSKGDSVQRVRKIDGKARDAFRAGKVVSSGFETKRRKH